MSSRAVILNVDDNEASRYARSRLLKHAGFDVVEAGTGRDALRLVTEISPQLVLMDVRLPDMSGIDVTRLIKANPATMRTPVAQISATFVTEDDRISGLEGGAEVYLTEPVEPQELITVVRTLLRLRTTEKSLSDSEARWQRLFGANIIGIIVGQGDRIVEANDVFLGMLGMTAADFKNRVLDGSTITPEEFHARDVAGRVELVREGTCAPYEKEFVRADGERVPVLIGGASLNGGGERWMAFVLDISERRRIEREREELLIRAQSARDEAERQTRLKDEFLANLSHELRTPMSTITGWLHLLRSGRLSKQQSEQALQAIERATQSQNQLIGDLLDVSRIVAGKLSIEREYITLHALIEASVESVALSAVAKGVRVHVSATPSDVSILGDRQRLQQVFWNLLSNAVKFTPAGGEIQVMVRASDVEAVVEVSDTGEGIPANFLPHVFDRFRQADGSTSRRHGGMGLGLAIVRHVVNLHGGSVGAASEGEGRGATFTVRLPRASAEEIPSVRLSEEVFSEDEPLRNVAILVVDDDPDARDVAHAVLEQAGAECRVAANALDALALLQLWKPAVVVSDIGMADIDGYGFVHRLRTGTAEGERMPALALTAFAREEDRLRALATGYDAHVVKPINPAALVHAIVQLVRQGRAPKAQAQSTR